MMNIEPSNTQDIASRLIGRNICFELGILPLDFQDGVLVVGHRTAGHADHADETERVRRALRKHTRTDVRVVHESPERIQEKLRELFPVTTVNSDSATDKLWGEVILRSINMHAANIILEPTLDGGRVRLDIDGDADVDRELDEQTFKRLVQRLANSAFGNPQPNIGQRGELNHTVDAREVNLRASSFPAYHPKQNALYKMVFRVLRAHELIPSLSRLGMSPEQTQLLKDVFAAPDACIAVGAPVGQGKSTFLNAAIKQFIPANKNNYGIEDPPELYNPVLSQTKINAAAGWTYEAALTEILRQEPKFIFLGEVLDRIVADLFLQAGTTGIPIATSLHAKDAIGIYRRLYGLNLDRRQVADTITATISLRLIRRLCPHCREAGRLIPERLRYFAERVGITLPESRTVYGRREGGCDECYGRGTVDRIGIFEVAEKTPELAVALRQDADLDEIVRVARSAGSTRSEYVTMYERAILLVLEGVVDPMELLGRIPGPATSLRSVTKGHPFSVQLERYLTQSAENAAEDAAAHDGILAATKEAA